MSGLLSAALTRDHLDLTTAATGMRYHSSTAPGGVVVDGSADAVGTAPEIESYWEVIRGLGDKDTTTHRAMEEILAVEEEYADDLLDLLADLT